MSKRVVHVFGPTTTGKTAIATRLARLFNGEIVNSEKFYCYDGFRLGSGVSDLWLTDRVPVHQYGFLPPTLPMISIAEHLARVSVSLTEIHDRGRVAIIEGSSFSFNRALFDLLSRQPQNFSYQAVGVRWKTDHLLVTAARQRVRGVFGDPLLRETEKAIAAGMGETYIMRKGVVYRAMSRVILGEINAESAANLIVSGICEIAHSQRARYDALDGVTWLEQETDNIDATVQSLGRRLAPMLLSDP